MSAAVQCEADGWWARAYLVLAHLVALVEQGLLSIHLLQIAGWVAVQLHAVRGGRH